MSSVYDIKIFYNKQTGGWTATAPELPGCFASGNTPAKSLMKLIAAQKLWLKAAERGGRRIPEPFSQKKLTGKFLLRLPKELHRKLAREANEQGVSMNQYMLYVMSQYERIGSQLAGRYSRKIGRYA